MSDTPIYDQLKQRVQELEHVESALAAAEKALQACEEKYTAIVQNIEDGYYEVDIAGNFTFFNDSLCRILGYARDELMGVNNRRYMDTENARKVYRAFHRVYETGEPYKAFDWELIRKDGSRRHIEASVVLKKDERGQATGFRGIARDTTQRKRAEAALQQSEEFLQQVFDAIQDGISVLDADLNVIKTNTWMERMYADRRPLVGRKCYRVYQERSSPCPWCPSLETVETGEPHTRTVPYPSADDPTGWIELSAFPITDIHGNVVRVIEYVKDVTARKKAEKGLRDLYETMELAQKMAGIGYWSFDKKEKKRKWSSHMYEIFGCDSGQGPPGREDLKKVFFPADWDIYENALHGALEGTPYDQIAKIGLHEDRPRFVRTQGYPKTNERGEIIGAFGTSQDVTEAILAERALRDSEEKYRRIFENSVVGFFQSTPEGRFVSANPAFARMLHYESAEDLIASVSDIATQYYVDGEDRRRYRQILQTNGYVENFEFRAKRKDGTPIWVSNSTRAYFDSSGRVVRYEGIVTDITQRKQAEKEKDGLQSQLIQSQKMESVGRLAGGIAHDFNNMLSVILGRSEMMLLDSKPGEPRYAELEEINRAAARSAALTRQLLAFARKQTIAPKVLDLNDTVEGILKMLRRLIGEDIDLVWQPDTNLWPVKMDPAQVDQILANLCVNARDAISETGKITIETANTVLDGTYCTQHAGFEPGQYVMVAVSDDGSGMDAETLKNAFEPFFTTKAAGEGTGLGLATVYGIVKQNNGFINIYSEPGQGSTVKIYLPRLAESLEAAIEPTALKVARGTETVLIVEDEASILDLGRTMLERLGYSVLVAQTPETALHTVENYGEPIHLLLTDVVMPGMNGKELKVRIEKFQPRIRVLYMSGYTANVIMNRGVLEDDVHFLQKPFSMESLADKVREALDGPGR